MIAPGPKLPRSIERDFMSRVRLVLQRHWRGRWFRNNVGGMWQGVRTFSKNGEPILVRIRRLTTGLCVGSSDIIGISTVTITPEMIGRTVGVFTALEIKAPKGIEREAQTAFIATIRQLGGIAGFVRSIEQLDTLMIGVDPSRQPEFTHKPTGAIAPESPL